VFLCQILHGVTENARLENAGLENVTPKCKSGKCRSGKCGTEMQGWKMQDWKMREKTVYGTPCIVYFCSVLQRVLSRFE